MKNCSTSVWRKKNIFFLSVFSVSNIFVYRSKLKNNPYTQDDNSYAVHIGDDLTKRRATLAFPARKLKGEKLIQDTWVMNCKVLWFVQTRDRDQPTVSLFDRLWKWSHARYRGTNITKYFEVDKFLSCRKLLWEYNIAQMWAFPHGIIAMLPLWFLYLR